MKQLILILQLSIITLIVFPQDPNNNPLEKQIKDLAKNIPELNNEVNISLSKASIQDFTRMVAMNSGVNITVDPSIEIEIVNEFNDVKVSEILVYLCQEYNLEIINIGSIISLKKKKIPEVVRQPIKKELKITYNQKEKLLNIDLQRDSLHLAIKKIISLTGENIILSPKLYEKIVSCYIVNSDIRKALESLALSNNMYLDIASNGYYSIDEKTGKNNHASSKSKNNSLFDINSNDEVVSEYWNINLDNSISVKTKNGNIKKIIETIADSLDISYSFVSQIEGEKTISFKNVNFDDFLGLMLNNTEYSFFKKSNNYFIGSNAKDLFITTEIIYLNYRRCENLNEFIPAELKKSLEIIESKEYNGIIVTGAEEDVENLRSFIKKIDKTVPVVLIEILIVDILKEYSVSTGINMGTGENPTTSSQTLLPGIDYQLSTESINNMINKINGVGWINLGKVTPEFYLTLKALEDNNILSINSTPKLATLNGHEAELSSGELRYYKEERNNYIGTQNPALSSSYQWKPISADLKIKIKPTVSGDDQITLEIEVSQDEFQKTNAEDAPPGSKTRSFKSIISVKNQEMILLGGLDRVTKLEASKGVPFLSRIPVLKWFFSSMTKSKSNSKLNIFIQPTIVY